MIDAVFFVIHRAVYSINTNVYEFTGCIQTLPAIAVLWVDKARGL